VQGPLTIAEMGLNKPYTLLHSVCAVVLFIFQLAGCAQPPTASSIQSPGLYRPSTYATPQIALAVQGSSKDMQTWIILYGRMRSKDRVSLFLLSFDSPFECPLEIACTYHPNSTWTMGRNELARMIHGTEEAAGHKYKYWAFHDADTWDLHCSVCRYVLHYGMVANAAVMLTPFGKYSFMCTV
jgi:hypothetical protein